MKLEKGQRVECALKNGWVISGIIEELSSMGLQLLREDGKGFVIIMRPNEEISVIKVFTEPVVTIKEEVTPVKEKKFARPKPVIDKEVQKVYESQADQADRLKSLAALRIEMNEKEREEMANKLSNHEIGETRKVQYGYPGFFKKPSAE